ncbi:hypothetical protein AR457_33905 [Streptomyces agglomeratus]|uniref:DUF6199 domain-containing protein n=1 Tax=Streptomyces agglomeratus TaxID=285458 RepID=A0A1E5PH70_9ACTN|nr:DUF6199 family natural product biosynthesis protein [Streptomyces agglomeratus]OEJ28882.1 hypothetical protein AS594_35090 [Streptomyces agglomeratus]OEJ37033.1 hypothetical protein BGK70_01400 [Streptomyces agglomeratus]OEJ48387.1 hypothetical protein AR457_33905 [Streptomyces agglomeratus]OEJ56889.1 hypothetical protein BGM19_01420 [Streptomyces agglomeratus]
MIIAFLCVFIVMGLVQVLKPQLLWRMNRPLQQPIVKDYDATEPSRAGYTMMRVTGAVFLAWAVWMLVTQAS